jgi:hypothetical protein
LFHHQPLHQHHSGYKFMLSKQQRQRGISHYGSAERLRAALSRAVTSKYNHVTSHPLQLVLVLSLPAPTVSGCVRATCQCRSICVGLSILPVSVTSSSAGGITKGQLERYLIAAIAASVFAAVNVCGSRALH